MNDVVLITVDNNKPLYEKCILNNQFIQGNPYINLVRFDNTKENIFIPVRYNSFLDGYDFSKDSWFVFLHNDFELLEDIVPKLQKLDKTKIHAPFGCNLYKKAERDFVKETIGDIYDCTRDGKNPRHLTLMNDEGRKMHIPDCMCIVVHSSLVNKYNLRFDENCKFDLYTEDFSLNANIKYNIDTVFMKIKCRHWSQLKDIQERSNYFPILDYILEKYKDYEHKEIFYLYGTKDYSYEWLLPDGYSGEDEHYRYDIPIDINNYDSRILSYNSILPNSCVLDAGCSCGALGKVLKQNKNCEVYGFEFDKLAIKKAESLNVYKTIHQMDLNTFETDEYPEYFNKFDYIALNDVIEHLVDPFCVIQKLKQFLKPEGYFLLSIPNISHYSIKSALLNNEWEYEDTGLLDRTHLRFFTAKSIQQLLAKCGITIEDLDFTVVDYLTVNKWFSLPLVVRSCILNSPESFVFQYFIKGRVDITKSTYNEILEHNHNKFVCEKKKIYKKIKQQNISLKKYFINSQRNYALFKYYIYKYVLKNKRKTLKYERILEI